MKAADENDGRVALDPSRMIADAVELAFPRYPGTPGDRLAIELLARKFGEAGLDVVEESFSYDIRIALRAIRLILISSAVLVVAAGALAQRSALLALLLLISAALVGGVMLTWLPGAERLYARPGPTRTSNVTAYRRAARPRLRVILMAHHDSKSQNLSFPVRMSLTIGTILGGLGLLLVLFRAVVHGAPPAPPGVAEVLSGLTAFALLVLSTLRSGNESPGGVDNAGSMAIVLELARVLPGELAGDVELVFLCPGAEEDHMVGAMRWLEAHREELAGCPVYALNFDGAGAPGKVVLIERYGLGRPFSETLSRAARAAANRLGIAFRGILMLPAMGIDAIPFAHHGLDCLTLSSGSLDRATISVHSSNDVADHLDPATLERVARLARHTASDLIREAAPRVR